MKIEVNEQEISVKEPETLVSNSNKTYTADFTFSEEWSSYTKKVVFMENGKSIIQAMSGSSIEIPKASLEEHDVHLYIGVYGINGDKIYPTTYADAGVILPGTEA
jgi:hypothetical protein